MDDPDLTSALSALAQPTRRAIFEAIASAGDGLTPSELADATGTQATNTSAHLTVLRNAGLVKAKRNGKSVNYSAKRSAVRALGEYLVRLAG